LGRRVEKEVSGGVWKKSGCEGCRVRHKAARAGSEWCGAGVGMRRREDGSKNTG
jgi:hypothetical protein